MNKYLDNFELQKAHMDKMFGRDVVQKGGVGSGRKIGSTSSGKHIFDEPSHDSHKDFDAQDHEDAAKAHLGLVKEHKARALSNAKEPKEKERNENIADKHQNRANQHSYFAKVIRSR